MIGEAQWRGAVRIETRPPVLTQKVLLLEYVAIRAFLSFEGLGFFSDFEELGGDVVQEVWSSYL